MCTVIKIFITQLATKFKDKNFKKEQIKICRGFKVKINFMNSINITL